MRYPRLVILAACVCLLPACAQLGRINQPAQAESNITPMLNEAFHQDDIDEGQVVLVGKIQLVPSLKRYEQDIPEAYKVNYVDQVYSYFASEEETDVSNWRIDSKHGSSVRAKLGDFFFPIVEQGDQYLLFSRVYVDRDKRSAEHFHLPADTKITTTEKMRYVYIGTLRYHRDAFGVVKKVQTIDEYSKALRATRARFGKKVKLHKQLMRVYLN